MASVGVPRTAEVITVQAIVCLRPILNDTGERILAEAMTRRARAGDQKRSWEPPPATMEVGANAASGWSTGSPRMSVGEPTAEMFTGSRMPSRRA